MRRERDSWSLGGRGGGGEKGMSVDGGWGDGEGRNWIK